MKSIPIALQNHLDQESTTLCHLFKVVCKDGTVLGYTDLDVDVTYDDGQGPVVYRADNGVARERMQSTADLSVDNSEISGYVADAGVTEQQIRAGLFDYARFRVYRVNYMDLAAGHEIHSAGTFGQPTFSNHSFRIELRSLTQQLKQPISKLYSLTCRAQFGDSQCKKEFVWVEATVTAVDAIEQDRLFTAAALDQPEHHFRPGVIEVLDGANAGVQMEVDAFKGGAVTLSLPLPYPLTVGTAFRIRQDCDKTFEMNKTRFNNVLNFRGEHLIPIADGGTNQIPGAQL